MLLLLIMFGSFWKSTYEFTNFAWNHIFKSPFNIFFYSDVVFLCIITCQKTECILLLNSLETAQWQNLEISSFQEYLPQQFLKGKKEKKPTKNRKKNQGVILPSKYLLNSLSPPIWCYKEDNVSLRLDHKTHSYYNSKQSFNVQQ